MGASVPPDDGNGNLENSADALGPYPLRCGRLALRPVLVEEKMLESRAEATKPVPSPRIVARKLIFYATRDNREL